MQALVVEAGSQLALHGVPQRAAKAQLLDNEQVAGHQALWQSRVAQETKRSVMEATDQNQQQRELARTTADHALAWLSPSSLFNTSQA